MRLDETLANPMHETALEVNISHNRVAGVFVTDGTGKEAGRFVEWWFKPEGRVDVPYWDVAVDPAIIKDHGDIWNERALAMLAAIFRMNIPVPNIEHDRKAAALR